MSTRPAANAHRTTLPELEEKLRGLSHSDEALGVLRAFATEYKSKDRHRLLAAPHGLLRTPLLFEDALEHGVVVGSDVFGLLQGDLVHTDSAYFMGERVEQGLYVVASSTCDLVRGRRKYATLLRAVQVKQDTPNANQLLGEALSFRTTSRMYLPPLPVDRDEETGALGYIVSFDGVANVVLDDLFLADRLASMTLVGWRIFGSFARCIMIRQAEGEAEIRSLPIRTGEA